MTTPRSELCRILDDNIIHESRQKLHDSIWKKLVFFPSHSDLTTMEIPEQITALEYIHPEDKVLEFGGSIGRNSCVINSLLCQKSNHVVVEPSPYELATLQTNRDSNGLGFQIANCAVSKVPLFSKKWHTYSHEVKDSIPVKTVTWKKFQSTYQIAFNTVVADCEGSLVSMIADFPEMLHGISKIILEHDFSSRDQMSAFYAQMVQEKFTCVCKYLKTSVYAPGIDWPDGVKEDPVFVSVWRRTIQSSFRELIDKID